MLMAQFPWFEWRGYEEGFWQGIWSAVFNIVALALTAIWVNYFFQRYRLKSTLRQELIDEVDVFTIQLYKPRKIYQSVLNNSTGLWGEDTNGGDTWGEHRLEVVRQLLGEIVEAIGRFRALQVKIVRMFGFHEQLFGHYLAIWKYLKEIRDRMERRQSLYFHHEDPTSVDAFYRLIDRFRLLVANEQIHLRQVGTVRPPMALLEKLRERGNAIYEEFFSQAEVKTEDKRS